MAVKSETLPTSSVWNPTIMATATALAAIASLALTESDFITLPILAVALIAARFVQYRISDGRVTWLTRIVLFALVATINYFRAGSEREGMGDPHLTALIGELLAAELVVEVWLRKPEGGARGVVIVFLSGLVLLMACNTLDGNYVRFFVPVYVLFLSLSLRGFRPPSEPDVARTRSRAPEVARGIALLVAFVFGFEVYTTFTVHHTDLTNWGMQVLREAPQVDTPSRGLSTSPTLSRAYGLQGTLDRVLRIEGQLETAHLRALSFDTYSHGHWGPAREQRHFTSVNPRELRGDTSAPSLLVTRLGASDDLLLAPLNTAGWELPQAEDIQWARAAGGPVRAPVATVPTYTLHISPSESYQGVFCLPPDAQERQRLTSVPAEVDPRVRTLARTIAQAHTNPGEVAHDVESYLMAHHGYSLDFDPGRGDPASSFLLSARPAHCEYFGSGAAILLRCLGIPARYVIGYYAHERENGNLVVRQRDAHAWTEAWIEGTGWITLDATPADGRPDKAGEPVPFWTRIKESYQDLLAVLQRLALSLRSGNGLVLGIAAVVVGVVFLGLSAQRQKKTQAMQVSTRYTLPAEEIAALSARFEALCARKGLLCPPGQTWSEFFASLPAAEPGTPPLVNVEVARAFIEGYNRVRFGQPVSLPLLTELQELLLSLESDKGEKA